ncbi:transcription factor bHLH69-like isoform X2 [Momordica charantia]|nr:transcription factor bHLH69-like isoform X2 [Momordica charantia]XP_022155560.1 transcription factor bHLH69-like isoform X2 [Momordica charantia]XP_022155561.1 transcription factor bHLH69-like isoform X2 [Momordica charantia]
MEGQNGCNNSVQILSVKLGANVNIVSRVPGDCTNHHHVLPADRSVNQTNFPLLTEWTQNVKTTPTFVEFIAETSNFSRKASTKEMLANVPFSTIEAVDGVSEIHGEFSYNHPTGSDSSKPTDSRKNKAPGILSKPRSSSSSRRGYSTDRQRRIRIAERLEALQELLPQSSKGNQASVLDDVIDHVKHLQLQIKDLSQSKLGGESSSEPFRFVEGYGHYMSHQEMQGEPLEEMVGKLLEVDPSAAAQLLENKGLFLMPMDFAEGSC